MRLVKPLVYRKGQWVVYHNYVGILADPLVGRVAVVGEDGTTKGHFHVDDLRVLEQAKREQIPMPRRLNSNKEAFDRLGYE